MLVFLFLCLDEEYAQKSRGEGGLHSVPNFG